MALTTSTVLTLANLLERFGPLPVLRIRYDPLPGTATEEDVIALERQDNRLFELVDGVLMEKTMGFSSGPPSLRSPTASRYLLRPIEHLRGPHVSGRLS